MSPKPLHPLQGILAETGLTPKLSLTLDLPVFELSGLPRRDETHSYEASRRPHQSIRIRRTLGPRDRRANPILCKSFHYYYFPMNDITLWLKIR